MWFYSDSLHTGSICCQRNPFSAALASRVYYFLLLWGDMYRFILAISYTYLMDTPLSHWSFDKSMHK